MIGSKKIVILKNGMTCSEDPVLKGKANSIHFLGEPTVTCNRGDIGNQIEGGIWPAVRHRHEFRSWGRGGWDRMPSETGGRP